MDNTNERNRRHLSTKKKKTNNTEITSHRLKNKFITLDLALPAGNNVLQIVNNQDAKGTKRQNRS